MLKILIPTVCNMICFLTGEKIKTKHFVCHFKRAFWMYCLNILTGPKPHTPAPRSPSHAHIHVCPTRQDSDHSWQPSVDAIVWVCVVAASKVAPVGHSRHQDSITQKPVLWLNINLGPKLNLSGDGGHRPIWLYGRCVCISVSDWLCAAHMCMKEGGGGRGRGRGGWYCDTQRDLSPSS